MARLLCVCGELLSNSTLPNDVTLRVYTEKEWEDKILIHDNIETTMIPFPRYDVWRCPNCERIHVFDGENLIKRYILEKYK